MVITGHLPFDIPHHPAHGGRMLIADTPSLNAFCATLANDGYITVDTEFVRERTYWPNLCLIQVGGTAGAAAIDPLATGLDLTPFHALMQNQQIVKVFHSGRQDLEIFYHDFGYLPDPIFDTQVAAMACGYGESVGYETLVRSITGEGLDKASRLTDWARRPLTERQLKYALDDVVLLRPVYEALLQQLRDKDRLHWLEEEMMVLIRPDTYAMDPATAWQRIKIRTRKSREFLLIQKIAAWRERVAQERNVPRVRICRDDAVLELASHPPKTRAAMDKMRGLSGGVPDADGLLAVIVAAQQVPEDDCPTPPVHKPLPSRAKATLEMLKMLLKIIADRENVAPRMIASSADLETLAAETTSDTPVLHGWRHDVFGQHALQMKSGALALRLKKGKIDLFDCG